MADRPILFKAEMIRAILAGTKTQTRRPLRDGTWLDPELGVIRMASCGLAVTGYAHVACPFGVPGDKLWVRETWAPHFMYEGVRPIDITIDARSCLFYAADGAITGGCDQSQRASKWRPAIHMPRAASRITLEVTEVRVERLPDISEADAEAEGIAYSERYQGWCIGQAEHFNSQDPIQSYFSLWESINGDGSVEVNPFVWVVNFKRVNHE